MERRLQAIAVFTFSLYFLLPLALWCWLWAVIFICVPACMPLIVVYFTFIFALDRSPVDGSRRPLFRGRGEQGNWWRRYADYFPITLVKTAHLDPSGKYIFGYHPHGIISVGAFACFATEGVRTLDLSVGETQPRVDRRGFSSLFPGIESRLLTLAGNFYIPFAREYVLLLGCCDASRQTFRRILAKGAGHGVTIVVGGAEESLHAAPGTIDLVLDKRKGFVREAVLSGASLVPCVAFGENELYRVYHPTPGSLLDRFQRWTLRVLHVGVPLFNGRSLLYKDAGLMPRRQPVVVVSGSPIPPPAEAKSTAEAVDFMHAEYIKAIHAIYAAHKDAEWNLPGRSRIGDLRIVG